MSSTFARKPGRTNSDISSEAIDLDSYDLDQFDQLANQPRKKSRGIRSCRLSGDEELPETDLGDDELSDLMDRDVFIEDDANDVGQEYVPVKSRRTTVSRTPVRSFTSSRTTSRTPQRSDRGEEGRTTRTSRIFSAVSDRSLATEMDETGSSGPLRTPNERSPYGFPVRTTAPSTTNFGQTTDSLNTSGGSIPGTNTDYPVNNDDRVSDTSLSARTSLSEADLQALQPKPRKKICSFLRICKTMIIIATVLIGIWAIYGVSVESNLDFWMQTFKSEIVYVHDTLGSLPSPLLMMIDQP